MLRDVNKRLQVLGEIDRIVDEQCKPCEIRIKNDNKDHALRYCIDECEHGKRLQECGNKLMEGDPVGLTKEAYQDFNAKGLKDRDIAKRFNISQGTLGYHKKKWGISNGRKKVEPEMTDSDVEVDVSDTVDYEKLYLEKCDAYKKLEREYEQLNKEFTKVESDRNKLIQQPADTSEYETAFKELKQDYSHRLDVLQNTNKELELQLDNSFKRFDELEAKYEALREYVRVTI